MYYKFERIWKEAVVGTAVPAFAWRDWGKPWNCMSGIVDGPGEMQKFWHRLLILDFVLII